MRVLKTDPVILVYCQVCGRWISEELRHNCDLPPAYRATRIAQRRERQ